MSNFKSGFVSIIGRTNVGKSTLINSLTGEKVAITANKCQTTRTAIKAIINRENSQIIFIDTPGIHKPKTKLGNTMIETVWASVPNSDVTLFIIDATSDKIGTGDKIILDKIKELKRKTILVINKIDLIEKEKLFKVIELYKNEYEFEAIIPVSSLENDNTEVILKEIEKILPEVTSILRHRPIHRPNRKTNGGRDYKRKSSKIIRRRNSTRNICRNTKNEIKKNCKK